MEKGQNGITGSYEGIDDVHAQPLRTLAPMFPPSLAFAARSAPTSPFLCITPFDSSDSAVPCDLTKASRTDGSVANIFGSPNLQTPPPMVAPLNEYSGMCQKSKGAKRTVSDSGTDNTAKKKKERRKLPMVQGALLLPPSSDPREAVEVILMTYDATRRRFLQLDEANKTKSANWKAGTIMIDAGLKINTNKTIGSLDGIEIGDIFYFRVELCLIGLHAPPMAGIDYMNAKINDESDTLAVSIVSSGGYEGGTDDADVLVYSGQGGTKVDGKAQVDDQKLERGNLALERSLHRSNVIRVIRGVKDNDVINGKIYYYDGLYKIHESWAEKGKTGFNVFKYKLVREPGQPDGFAIWKKTEKWKEDVSSRDGVILPDISSGVESIPVCLVNETDTEKSPGVFSYSTKVLYSNPISFLPPLHGCLCPKVCFPGDSRCFCTQLNGGHSPYGPTGLLAMRRSLVYECGTPCRCSANCRNRVVQKGIKLHFEVFRTGDKGWGLRSWDPIRAGTFICEYSGEVFNAVDNEGLGEENDYIFEPNSGYSTFKWNPMPELLQEPSVAESPKPFPFLISAKKTGNVSRFINHSCSPNLFWQPVLYDHGNEDYPHIMFFAMKHIPPMTELTYDYGQSGRRSKRCFCGSRNCKGSFG